MLLPIGHVRPLHLQIDKRQVEETVQSLPYGLNAVEQVVALRGVGHQSHPSWLVDLITDHGLLRLIALADRRAGKSGQKKS